MLVIDNVPDGLAIGTGGRVGRVMSGRILDGGSRKGCFTDVRAHRSGRAIKSTSYGEFKIWEFP